MRTHQFFPSLFALTAMLLMVSCMTPTKLVETGNYDDAILASVNKLAGKKKKKEKDVAALEFAFEKAISSKMAEVESLKATGRADAWPEIFYIFDRIGYLQDKIDPLLPLVDENGYKANFKFVRVTAPREEAKEKMVAYYYDTGNRFLADARRGDKHAARQAYNYFAKINVYYDTFRDERKLRDEAEALGITNILVEFDNHSGMFIPEDFAFELLGFGTQDLDEQWERYYIQPGQNVALDYSVRVFLTDIDISPDFVRERAFQEEKEITDGYKYLRDAEGNIRLDSNGNEMKRPIKKIVRANILETYQNKMATVGGSLEFYDHRSGSLLDVQQIGAEIIFENYFAAFSGDARALNSNTRTMCDNRPLPFPADGTMLLQAADRMKPILKERIRHFHWRV